MPRRYAAADIGSNTVHLLVAEITARGTLRRLVNESEWLSLGEKVSRDGEIKDADADRLLETLSRFQKTADQHQVEGFYVFATEAMRAARNHEQLIQRIRKTLGITVQLISPQREAELSLAGITLDAEKNGAAVLLEVGGGSAQVAYLEAGHIVQEFSLKLGTGRLIADFHLEQPIWPPSIERLERHLAEKIESLPKAPGSALIASGGVARGMIRALHPDGDPNLQLFELDFLNRAVMDLELTAITKRFRVKVKRAQTLLPGSSVFRAFLRHFESHHMFVSEFGVREGAVLEMLSQGVAR